MTKYQQTNVGEGDPKVAQTDKKYWMLFDSMPPELREVMRHAPTNLETGGTFVEWKRAKMSRETGKEFARRFEKHLMKLFPGWPGVPR